MKNNKKNIAEILNEDIDTMEKRNLFIVQEKVVEDVIYSIDYSAIMVKVFKTDSNNKHEIETSYIFRNTKENEEQIKNILIQQIEKFSSEKKKVDKKEVNKKFNRFSKIFITTVSFILFLSGVSFINIFISLIILGNLIIKAVSLCSQDMIKDDYNSPYSKFSKMIIENNNREALKIKEETQNLNIQHIGAPVFSNLNNDSPKQKFKNNI